MSQTKAQLLDSAYESTVLTGSTNNTITTVTGAKNIQGEANLTWDAQTLHIKTSGDTYTRITGDRGNANDLTIGSIEFANDNNSQGVVAEIRAITGNSGTQNTKGQIVFYTDDGTTKAERVRIESSGHLKIDDGNLVIGTAGKGIDFSAQTATSATGATTGAELLDHYEEGTFTPVAAQGTFTVEQAHYTRIGRSVTYQIYGSFSSNSSGSAQSLTNFPFAMVAGTYYSAAVNSNTGSSSHPVAQLGAADGHMYFKDTSNNAFNGGDMSGHFIVLSGVFNTT